MNNKEIAVRRLINQQIAAPLFNHPNELVTYMVATQAQEYAMAKWAVGLRLNKADDAAVEQAFNQGAILRTHVMRPTWHFVSPEDIRWMLALTAPRVHAANAFMYRKLELDKAILHRSSTIIAKTLEGGKHLTRETINQALEQQHINASGLRLIYMMMHSELEGLICSGPRQGNQFTYALLAEWVPATRVLDKEEALAQLARRYFTSRGPATLQDFAYWSALTLKEAREGLELVKQELEQLNINNQPNFSKPSSNDTGKGRLQKSFLMPDYDEYGMSYKDRSALFAPKRISGNTSKLEYNRMLIINGVIRGTWKRTIEKDSVQIIIQALTPFNKSDIQHINRAAKAFGKFVGKKVGIEF